MKKIYLHISILLLAVSFNSYGQGFEGYYVNQNKFGAISAFNLKADSTFVHYYSNTHFRIKEIGKLLISKTKIQLEYDTLENSVSSVIVICMLPLPGQTIKNSSDYPILHPKSLELRDKRHFTIQIQDSKTLLIKEITYKRVSFKRFKKYANY